METLLNYWYLIKEIYPFSPKFVEKDFPDLTGKVYIVTGASSGLGLQAARKLVKAGATVYLVGRTKSKFLDAEKLLRADSPNGKFEFLFMDYNDLTTIKPAIDEFLARNTRLDGIIHNAGMNFSYGAKSVQGTPSILAVNAIAPHLVQKLLDNILIKTAKTATPGSVRIVWISSSAHRMSPPKGSVLLPDPEALTGSEMDCYAQSKSINYYQGVLWPKKHPESNIISVSVHPGLVKTSIARTSKSSAPDKILDYLGYSAEKASYAELYPLLSPDVTLEDNGSYYIPFDCKETPRHDTMRAANGEPGDEVWAWLESKIKPFV